MVAGVKTDFRRQKTLPPLENGDQACHRGGGAIVAALILAAVCWNSPRRAFSADEPSDATYCDAHVPFTPAPSEAEQKVIRALHTHVALKCTKLPLTKVAAALAAEAKKASKVPLTIAVDTAALKKQRISPELPITSEVADSPLEDVLGGLLWNRDLDYHLQSGKLVITTRDATMRRLIKRTYDVAKLCKNDDQLVELLKYINESGSLDEWRDYGGIATMEPDRKARRVTITHTFSNHMRIVQAIESWHGRTQTAQGEGEDDEDE